MLAWRRDGVALSALAHITGGGLLDNLPRVLPERLAARIDRSAWTVPEPFATLVRWGDLPDDEAFRVFNMGIGMVAVPPARTTRLPRRASPIGRAGRAAGRRRRGARPDGPARCGASAS